MFPVRDIYDKEVADHCPLRHLDVGNLDGEREGLDRKPQRTTISELRSFRKYSGASKTLSAVVANPPKQCIHGTQFLS
jgi:hypothetical protein